jgi:sulfoxide reductase heme-binding subunit YedZ
LAGQYAKVSADVMISAVKTLLNSRYFTWAVLALPFGGLLNAFRDGDLFYGEIIHASGELSARLLLLSLAITPLRLYFSESSWPNWLLHRRRYFGVAAFAYAVLHTAVYLDRKIGSGLILQEAAEFSMWTGWLAMLILVPLAATSNDASVQRLRRRWKKLHRWVYLAALLTFTHWIFIAFDFVPGLIHFLVLAMLETYRIWKRRQLKLLSTKALHQQ